MKPHHGRIDNLNETDSLRLLKEGHLGHLACHDHNEIYLVPISYAFEDGFIYSHSRPGKKIEIMRKNSRICIQVEDIHDFFQWKSVIAWGHFEELQGDAAATAMHMLLGKMTEREIGRGSSLLEVDMAALLETAIIYRMKVSKMTGRCEGYERS